MRCRKGVLLCLVVGISLPATAQGQASDGTTEAADSERGLLFNLNNIFTVPAVLSGYQGFGVGGQVSVGPGMIARVGADLSRQTDPVDIVKTTRTDGGDVTVSYDLVLPPGGWSATHSVALAADVLFPISRGDVAAYTGAGLFAGYLRQDLDYTDDLTVTDQITEVNDSSDTLSSGLRGILGVTWQISDNFSLFAEYHLRVEVIAWQSAAGQTTVTNSSSGTPASNRVETEHEETRFFNLDTGLGQGTALGLLAHF